jgi:hypothetical protein
MKKVTQILTKSISVFPDVRNVDRCIITSVYEWLQACKSPKNKKLLPLVESIRNISDQLLNEVDPIKIKSLKKQKSALKLKLPAVVMGAELTTRAASVPDMEKIIARTGVICFDIDTDGNPGMDAKSLRNKLALNRNVIFVALSVSGHGVWGLIEIQHLNKMKQHFEQLKADFLALGIKIDSSKGGNATDLRYYSYDPDAYLCEEYKIYNRLSKPNQQVPIYRRPYKISNVNNPIKIAMAIVESSVDGEKHIQLLKAAKLLGGYVGSGSIALADARTALETAISYKNIQSFSAAQKTITSGLQYGMTTPIYPAIRGRTKNVTDPIYQYFEKLNINAFSNEIMVDGVPLQSCIKLWRQESVNGNKEAYFKLKALQIELFKI